MIILIAAKLPTPVPMCKTLTGLAFDRLYRKLLYGIEQLLYGYEDVQTKMFAKDLLLTVNH